MQVIKFPKININFICHTHSEGHCKRVVGEGMPLVDNPEEKGDMIIKFHVQFPRSLKPSQKALIKQALQQE